MSRKTLVLRGRGEPVTLWIEGRGGLWRLSRDGVPLEVRSARLPDGRLSLLLPDGRQICGRVLPRARGHIDVSTRRGLTRLALADRLHDRVEHAAVSLAEGNSAEEIRALMPGRVIEIAVAQGDHVAAGTLLLVLEAMKMQNEIRATGEGFVGKIEIDRGGAVEAGTRMLTILPSLD